MYFSRWIWKKITGTIFLLAALYMPLLSQHIKHGSISFLRLDKTSGLPDNYIWDMCLDNNNYLWIATGEGLCSFDGKIVTRYFNTEHPELKNNHIRQVVCDSSNRIWVLQEDGFLTVADEYRNFRLITGINGTPILVKRIFNSPAAGILLFTETGFFKQAEGLKKNIPGAGINLQPFAIEAFSRLKNDNYLQYEFQDDENVFFVSEKKIFRLSFKTRRVENEYTIPHTVILSKKYDKQVMAFDKEARRFFLFDKESGAVSYPFDRLTDAQGQPVKSIVTNSLMLDDENMLMATGNEGIFIWSLPENRLYNYRHNVADITSIANNYPKVIVKNDEGWVFLSSTPNGISYFNRKAIVSQQTVFLNENGDGYDGHINSIASFDDSVFYLGVSSTLIKWDSKKNKAEFLGSHKPTSGPLADGVRAVACDKQGHIWVAVPRLGVFVRDKTNRFIKQFTYDSLNKGELLSNYTQFFFEQGNYMWLATANGLCRINTGTLGFEPLPSLLALNIKNKNCSVVWFADSASIWIGTRSNGAINYNFHTDELKHYTATSGLSSNYVLAINKDKTGSLYFGTLKGLNILTPNGQWKTFTSANGLLNDRTEIVQPDNEGRIWISNSTGLACFSSGDGSLKVFDEQYGLSAHGFRGPAFHRTADGRLFWGTEKGLQYFYPGKLIREKLNYRLFINRVETKDTSAGIAKSTSLHLTPGDNSLGFSFSTVDYNKQLRSYYEYKLEGADKNWNKASDINVVRYNSLAPGRYTFLIKVSNDNINWRNAENTVTIIIAKHWWQQWWFKLTGILLASGLFYIVLRYFRNKQKRKNEELESELVINYFASQINSRYKTDELLWDVAKNLIGKMGFENCMIYLWNDDKTVLVQRAGYGTKGSMPAIKNMEGYNIPKGKGIVGAAVESNQSLLVNDTSKDKRYFTADGTVMLSELCVSLVHGNETLGAINIEHRQKNYFTTRHVQMLSTIAVLCANQVQRIKAEEEKQQATLELLENKRRAMEFRLQSLRLQMNPHFLFNALNSVQQMILANEEMVATRYLSRFSKLLRTILVHSDSENITLKEEIEILNLYAELESIRFKGSFKYEITCDENIDQEEIKIPTLLVQPFVENAIWHGLMHKEGDRLLQIHFTEQGNFIRCAVEDNGVGRQKSGELKLNDGARKGHKSRGIEVSAERLRSMKLKAGLEGNIHITDKKDAAGVATGTLVQIDFPVQNK